MQDLCRADGALFVLDEVMTGFRVARGGAQVMRTADDGVGERDVGLELAHH